MSLYPKHLGRLGQRVEQLLAGAGIEQHPLFEALKAGTLSDAQRATAALQIYHVVRCFPRFLAAIVTNLDDLKMRLPLVGNLLEEHGHLDEKKAHVNAYVDFLKDNGCTDEQIAASRPSAAVVAYNRAILDLCLHQPWPQGLAALGVIEDVVARVSPVVNALARREAGNFFDAHEALDVGHAIEIYELLVERYEADQEAVDLGLELGLYYHSRMYEDVLRVACKA